MINYKKKIILELKKTILEFPEIYDIWLYGSISDRFSDVDIIIVYNTKPPKISFSKIIESKIYDGSIIYIPKKLRYDIFLFEKLKIYSIKDTKPIQDKIPKNFVRYRNLTSFLERYYERRQKLRTINKENLGNKIRFLKSIIFSYKTFYNYCTQKKIKVHKVNFFKQYKILRDNCLTNKNNKKIMIFVNELKVFDKKFCKNSVKILDKIFEKKEINFYFKFNSYTKFYFKKKNINEIPFILGEIYNFYALQNNNLSRKIKKNFIPKIQFYEFNKHFENYLKKKIIFLKVSYNDLKRVNFKKGMYRMTWYL